MTPLALILFEKDLHVHFQHGYELWFRNVISARTSVLDKTTRAQSRVERRAVPGRGHEEHPY